MAIKIAKIQTADRLINQLQLNISSVIEPLFANTIGQFVFTLNGFSKTPAGTGYYQVGTTTSAVTILLPTVTGTSNATTMFLVGLPSSLWPARTQTCLCRIEDNGTVGLGIVTIDSTGVVNFSKDVTGASFTNSGTKGLASCSLTYIKDI